ncbi:MAG TPA: cell division protein FtsQ/DivIB [Solirubrobacterales bacterium]|nr:cell division protein FtsQ/DivIB [Solirubrobacterales bacterium]
MRVRFAAGALAVVLVGVAVYWFALRQETTEPTVIVPRLAAQIGEGEEAVGVSADGAIVPWLPLPEEPPLPQLPLEGPPKGGRVKGPALEQVRVLAAVPDELRPYVESSYFGESGGVDVNLTTGVELRFGNSSQAARKWRAAAGVLADPSITTLDYVDLQAPSRPTYEGSEHELPPAP